MIQVDDGGRSEQCHQIQECSKARSGLVEVWRQIRRSLVKIVVIRTHWLPLRNSADDRRCEDKSRTPNDFTS